MFEYHICAIPSNVNICEMLNIISVPSRPESYPICVCEALALPRAGPKDKLVKSRAMGGGPYVFNKHGMKIENSILISKFETVLVLALKGSPLILFRQRAFHGRVKRQSQHYNTFTCSLSCFNLFPICKKNSWQDQSLFSLSRFNFLSVLYFSLDRPIIEFESLLLYFSSAATFVSQFSFVLFKFWFWSLFSFFLYILGSSLSLKVYSCMSPLRQQLYK